MLALSLIILHDLEDSTEQDRPLISFISNGVGERLPVRSVWHVGQSVVSSKSSWIIKSSSSD